MDACKKITISVTEAAELLGVSRPTVYKLMRRTDFPSLRIGTRTLIHRAKLEEWAAIQTENPDGEGLERC